MKSKPGNSGHTSYPQPVLNLAPFVRRPSKRYTSANNIYVKGFVYQTQLPLVKWQHNDKSHTRFLVDNTGARINVRGYEQFEQYLTSRWILPNDCVLELGARFGVVSCTINSILKNPRAHIAVEPDAAAVSVLYENRARFGAGFEICPAAISERQDLVMVRDSVNGLGNSMRASTSGLSGEETVPVISPAQFWTEFGRDRDITAMVVDCEGCALQFFKDNFAYMKKLTLVILEADACDMCDYAELAEVLVEARFGMAECLVLDAAKPWYESFQQVWIKLKPGEPRWKYAAPKFV